MAKEKKKRITAAFGMLPLWEGISYFADFLAKANPVYLTEQNETGAVYVPFYFYAIAEAAVSRTSASGDKITEGFIPDSQVAETYLTLNDNKALGRNFFERIKVTHFSGPDGPAKFEGNRIMLNIASVNKNKAIFDAEIVRKIEKTLREKFGAPPQSSVSDGMQRRVYEYSNHRIVWKPGKVKTIRGSKAEQRQRGALRRAANREIRQVKNDIKQKKSELREVVKLLRYYEKKIIKEEKAVAREINKKNKNPSAIRNARRRLARANASRTKVAMRMREHMFSLREMDTRLMLLRAERDEISRSTYGDTRFWPAMHFDVIIKLSVIDSERPISRK